jgi:probable rRNA maturation factor
VTQRSIYRSPWRIDVTIRDGVDLPIRISRLAAAVAGALDAAGAPSPASIGLILADDAELAELNRAHLGADGTTDVLSFPLLPATSFALRAASAAVPAPATPPAFVTPPGQRVHLGDIVVSVERAADQASTGRGGQTGDVRWSTSNELRLLVTHGTLHICGWDHAEPTEEADMRALEQRLLASASRTKSSG